MLKQAAENTILFVKKKKKKLKKLQIKMSKNSLYLNVLLIKSRIEPYKNDECRTFFYKKDRKKTFYTNKQPIRAILPTLMAISFNADEIGKVIAIMKPSKSPGCDEIPVELTKYASKAMHKQIAEICNTMTGSSDTPIEITWNFEEAKSKGPPSIVRPIILPSFLRKTLAACM